MKEIMEYNIIPETIEQAVVWRPDFFNLRRGIVHHFGRTTLHYLICGCLLCEAHSKKIWEKDGNGANSFGEWIEKVINLKRSQVQRMMSIWEALKPIIDKHSELILQIDFSKLALISPYLIGLDEDKQVELLHSGKELSVKALENNLKEMSGKPAQDTCEHSEEENWLRCKKCGKFRKGE